MLQHPQRRLDETAQTDAVPAGWSVMLAMQRWHVNAPSGAVLPKELVGPKPDKFLANFVF